MNTSRIDMLSTSDPQIKVEPYENTRLEIPSASLLSAGSDSHLPDSTTNPVDLLPHEDVLALDLNNTFVWGVKAEGSEFEDQAYFTMLAEDLGLNNPLCEVEPLTETHQENADPNCLTHGSKKHADADDRNLLTINHPREKHMPPPPPPPPPPPAAERGGGQLQDAKRVLAEQAAARENKKRSRSTEQTKSRKRTRKVDNTSSRASTELVQQNLPVDRPKKTPRKFDTAPATAASRTLHSASDTAPLTSSTPNSYTLIDDLEIVSALVAAFAVFFNPSMAHTADDIAFVTDIIYRALYKDRSRFMIRGVRIWSHIHDMTSGWTLDRFRVLARMVVLPGWLWVWEKLVELVESEGGSVDVRKMVARWKWHEQRMDEWVAMTEDGSGGKVGIEDGG